MILTGLHGQNRSPKYLLVSGMCQKSGQIHYVLKEHYEVRVIVIVHLVTHSIFPNLNSGLVPVDPGGLVIVCYCYQVLKELTVQDLGRGPGYAL